VQFNEKNVYANTNKNIKHSECECYLILDPKKSKLSSPKNKNLILEQKQIHNSGEFNILIKILKKLSVTAS